MDSRVDPRDVEPSRGIGTRRAPVDPLRAAVADAGGKLGNGTLTNANAPVAVTGFVP